MLGERTGALVDSPAFKTAAARVSLVRRRGPRRRRRAHAASAFRGSTAAIGDL